MGVSTIRTFMCALARLRAFLTRKKILVVLLNKKLISQSPMLRTILFQCQRSLIVKGNVISENLLVIFLPKCKPDVATSTMCCVGSVRFPGISLTVFAVCCSIYHNLVYIKYIAISVHRIL